MTQLQRIPPQLRAGILAVLTAIGLGAGGYVSFDRTAQDRNLSAYIQAAANDGSTSDAAKVALMLASYYESSYRHIGTPFVDKLGRGQPLTVCNGVTSAVVRIDPKKYYTPSDCYWIESAVAKQIEAQLRARLPAWETYTVLQRATIIDFVLNKGISAFDGSTMRRKLLAGDVIGACRENERWTRGTLNGVSTVLPGLVTRANANSDLCAEGLS